MRISHSLPKLSGHIEATPRRSDRRTDRAINYFSATTAQLEALALAATLPERRQSCGSRKRRHAAGHVH